MAFEPPTALIHQLRAALRGGGGASFSGDAPPLPTVEVAVAAALEPSSPSPLRCDRCRGALLRGARSPRCVLCGAERRGDAAPHPIPFASSAACRWLLDSLGLDGSEPVILDTESSDSNKGKDTPKSGLVLSDLLDLELRWTSNTEEQVTETTKEVPTPSTYALNLSGVDLDSYFSEEKTETPSIGSISHIDKLTATNQSTYAESHTLSGSEDDLFENFQSSGKMISSLSTKDDESGPSSAAWEAEFQSANFETSNAETRAADFTPSGSISHDDLLTTRDQSPNTKSHAISGSISHDDQLITRDQSPKTKNHAISGSENFDLFENFQSSGSKISSLNTKDSESGRPSTGRVAEFHAAVSETLTAEPGPVHRTPSSGSISHNDQLKNTDQNLNMESHAFSASETFDPFENFQSTRTTLSSLNTKDGQSGRSSTGWEVEFQSATLAAESGPVDFLPSTGASYQDDRLETTDQSANTENHALYGSENFDLSASFQYSPTKIKSLNTKDSESGRSSTGWEMEFQSAAFDTSTAEPVQVDFGPSAVSISHNDQLATMDQSVRMESQEFSSSETFDTVVSSHSSGTKISSLNTKDSKSGRSSTGWEAEFQSATFETLAAESEPVDLMASTGSISHNDQLTNIEHSVNTESHASSGPETFDLFVNSQSSGTKLSSVNTKDSESGRSSTGWEAEFQSASPSNSQFVGAPSVEATISQEASDQNETNNKSASLEVGNDGGQSASSYCWIPDDLWPMNSMGLETDVITSIDENNSGELDKLSVDNNAVPFDMWPTSSNKEVDPIGKVYDTDDWQDFTSSAEAQGGSSNLQEQIEVSPSEPPLETKSGDLWPISSTNDSDSTKAINGDDDSFDEWHDFASSSQTAQSFTKPGDEKFGMYLEHPLETKSAGPTSSVKEVDNSNIINEDNDLFDDWQNFASSSQAHQSLTRPGDQNLDTSLKHPSGMQSTDTGPTSSIKELDNSKSLNEDNDPFDDWQDFASSSQGHQSLTESGGKNLGMYFKDPSETKSTGMDPTSSIKKSDNYELKNDDNDPFNWQDFFSSTKVHQNLAKQGGQSSGMLFKDPSVAQSSELGPTNSVKQLDHSEIINEENDLFDDWQDFTSSGQVAGCLSNSVREAEVPLHEKPSGSKFDDLQDMEFGGFMSSDSFSEAPDGKRSSSEDNIGSCSASRVNGRHEIDIDPFSTLWGAMDANHLSVSMPKPPKTDIEKLFSQMHDFSFMPKDDCPAPDKLQNLQSTS
ncbi:uncharacterized protein LOC109711839 isoform X1 [Ananas comosus]|uniref:Uncharacterized protein LOC109711839 isoform X1 n=1 Tax=Ananas comosus TaxID=4615 RepID=A0A6P5FBN4_ANACO|nr:uncharacterized protein LOC109711839 isoform X1 [Ananas comosus]XP_020090725.1 uncharacterized protein LOC109711839 isoform X1 [Ananas comosus]